MKLFYTVIFVMIGLVGLSQKTIQGVVSNEKNETIPYVKVKIINKNQGTETDENGAFKLMVNASDSIRFSAIGYENQTLSVQNSIDWNITLVSAVNELDEVVVTALGLKRNKRDLGYAVQTLKGEEITEVRHPNLVNALAGRVAGVQTTNGSSGVGSSSRVIIRGETSLSGNNQPLFVVDGVPVSNEFIANNTENLESGFHEVDYGNGIGDLSPDDIASINVLKGPSAAALYGARAAGGVIVIETKEGKASDGIGVSINSSVTFEEIAFLPQFQNRYGQGAGGVFAYEDGLGSGIGDGGLVSFGPEMNGQLITQYDGPSYDENGNPVRGGDVIARNGNPITPTAWNANPDNVRDFFQTGVTSQQNIALSGANDNGSFRLSYTRLDNQGTLPNSDFIRNNVALTSTYNFTDRLSVRTHATFINSSSNHRPGLGYGSENVMYSFLWMGRQVDLTAAEDYWQAGQEGFKQYTYNSQWLDNPYFNVYENRNGFEKNRLLGNAMFKYEISEHLNLRFRSGVDTYSDLRTSRRAFSTQRFPIGAYREDDVSFTELNTDLMLAYDNNFGEKLKFNAAIGANNFTQETRYKSLLAGQLSVPGIYNFENSKIPLEASQFNAQKQINSVYGLTGIAYDRFLFLDVTLRNDWSTTLPVESNSFAYYSVNGAFVFTEKLNTPDWFSYGKLRVSTSSVGSDTDPFQLRNTYAFNQNYGSYPLLTNSSILLNENLKPERINALEAGTELYFFDERIGLDVTVYQNTAKNQIITLPTSSSSGYAGQVINGGVIQSRGVEVMLTTTNIKKENFSWSTYVNFSKGASYVEELPEGIDQYTTGFARLYTTAENTVFYIADSDGGRIGDMYGTGFQKTEDGRIIYGANGLPLRDNELRYLGNYNPDFILGIGNQFEYKGFKLNVLLDWRHGGEIISRTRAVGSTSGVLAETIDGREDGIIGDGVVNVGTESNPIYEENTTAVSASEYYNQFYNRANEESSVYDASYLKIREIGLSYTFPDRWVSKFNIEAFKVGFIARNLFTWTENPHFDPELSAMQGTSQIYGVEDLSYPSSRSYGIQVQFKF
ncbi:SusC/RagA family TonB-linked outer membrane protein [Brumimicrobium aurantiacum]|uniref:SusC/RagA family TonB-linked outer membrane protein n=1 Tax=Brumimicrobium aurantiacum TaxID=1737063 RepID=A0A3E1EUD4_9FLAO|nr:SusC/RagA family TonB-linked outer membrane protein [Brumimicrobium aurantiacum]RFC53171.1 SusC/RagA family TonB-linked outer membrane protein [Brumimicrobium aurantiacum]